jgi:UDP-N-acetylmuramoyl-tripeptide--D-alanyl-D-alanine ligase
MNLREIARLCGASQMLDERLAETEPAGLSIDSRAIARGELFIAIPGERVDGHQYVREVLEKGACAAVVVHKRLSHSRCLPVAGGLGEYANRLIFVESTPCALQQLAARVLARWHRPITAITGSAGKTTVKDLTAQVLYDAGNVLKSQGNLNTSYGLPLTVGRMITGGARPSDFDFAVLEMGMSSFGEISRLTDIAPPTVGVVTNVGDAHIEFFGSRTAIAAAKAEMVDGVKSGGTIVLNADDRLVADMRNRRSDIAVTTFGIDEQADVMASEIAVEDDLSGTRFVLKTADGTTAVRLRLIGRHNVYNALAAASVAQSFGLSPQQIASGLAAAAPSKMRGELIRFAGGFTVIDDSYNSNPQALIQSISAMRDARGFRRRIVVAGEMLELGEQGAELHRKCGGEIAAMNIDRLIGIRGLARELVAGAVEAGMSPEHAHYCETPDAAAEVLLSLKAPGDLVLIKASRGVRAERVIERLRAGIGSS